MSTHPRPLFRRRGDTMTSTTSSHSSSGDDDLDAITPCPPHSQPNARLEQLEQQTEEQEQQTQQPTHRRRPSIPRRARQRPTSWRSTLSSSSSSDEDTTAATTTDSETLWRRMLALQRRFGCYNSARMRAALDGEDGGVPSRTCLDLLNDSIDTLPEEERQRLEAFLESSGGGDGKGSGKERRSWRERLLHGTATARDA